MLLYNSNPNAQYKLKFNNIIDYDIYEEPLDIVIVASTNLSVRSVARLASNLCALAYTYSKQGRITIQLNLKDISTKIKPNIFNYAIKGTYNQFARFLEF